MTRLECRRDFVIFKLLQDLLAEITYANILVYNIGSAFGVVKDLKRIRKWAQTGRPGPESGDV